MNAPKLSRESLALLPWIIAALAWVGLVAPLRADRESRLNGQTRVRRDRLKAERGLRESQTARTRVASALAKACNASPDPAALRQRAVSASAGLPLSPFALTVTGGPEAGASVDATGTSPAALELLRRLGDPRRGGFLRSVSMRDKGGLWTVSATTGVFASLRNGLLEAPSSCPGIPDPAPEAKAAESAAPRVPVHRREMVPPLQPAPTPASPVIEAPSAPPIALVAFLLSNGRPRVSIHIGDELRVVAPGQTVDGWTCVSIDLDEGAVFTSPVYGRVVLKALSPPH